jgi:hypothetical protein
VINLIPDKMKRVVINLLAGIMCVVVNAQVPQGFNYQAIARDGSGNPIAGTTIQVNLSILADTSSTPVILWEELHDPVKTNAFGMFTVVLGNGVKKGGSAPAFSNISWTAKELFIKTQVYYLGEWKYLGSARLWSVPYSMIAGDLADTINKLVVRGQTDVMDEALFEVKNKNGQTVFAVYNEGVRIYVDDGVATKKAKGGFAIGGFDAIKAEGQKYFFLDPDSIRMYIDDSPLKKSKGGFAIGGFDQLKSGNTNFLNVATDASGIINPSQNRVMWYPIKNAFLAGRVRIGTPDSVGLNSFTTGYESRSRGMYSQAMGFKAIANGDYSTAIGKNAVANNVNSFAFGEGALADNEEGYAIGRGAVATGYRSFAFGSAGIDKDGYVTDVTRALGDYSFAIGQGSNTIGTGSVALGLRDSAKGLFSVSIGNSCRAIGDYSTSIGTYSIARGYTSAAIGGWNIASGQSSTAIGGWTIASGMNSTAMGYQTIASGNYSTAMGLSTRAKGHNSTVMGWGTVASGYYSTAVGWYTKAKAHSSFVIGQFNDTTCSASAETTRDLNDPLFICGNGTWLESLSNAFTVYNNGNSYIQSNLGIGTTAPVTKLDIAGGNNWDLNGGEGDFRIGNSAYRLKFGVALGGGGAGAAGIMQYGMTGGYNVLSLGAQGNYLLYINGSSQNVGIGTNTPGYKLTVNGTAWCSSGAWTGSDIRWKKNISVLNNTLSGILSLQAVNYDLRTDEFPEMGFESQSQIGLIAQDVEKVFPLLVMTDNTGYKAVAYDKLSAILVEGMKEQQKQIESVRQENQQLKSELNELKALFTSLISKQSVNGDN